MYVEAKTAAARDLVERVDDALNGLTYTYWLFGGNVFNATTGVYKVDCTGFVNRMVDDAAPSSYDTILDLGDTTRPSATDYYDLFKTIPYGTTRHKWTRVEKAASMRPGDVLVTKYKLAHSSTGHAMIVVDVPKRDTRWSNVYRVRVADSAKSGHTTDNRGSTGSGVGAGYILVRYDSTSGRPYAYAWSTGGTFKTDAYLAIARPNS